MAKVLIDFVANYDYLVRDGQTIFLSNFKVSHFIVLSEIHCIADIDLEVGKRITNVGKHVAVGFNLRLNHDVERLHLLILVRVSLLGLPPVDYVESHFN